MLVVIALVLALVIKTFAIQAFFIPSASMENTLEIDDRVLINKLVYHLRPIHRGDIVVFDGTGSWDSEHRRPSSNIFSKAADELEGIVGISHDSSIYIKRVIGLPGDHVVCCNASGQITVNGVPLHRERYLYPGNQPSAQTFSVTVPPGRLWVMGDHRAVSYDSRGHMGDPGGGTIPESAVLGRAFVIIWPPSRWGFLNIPATFEQPQLNAPAASGGNAAAGAPRWTTARRCARPDRRVAAAARPRLHRRGPAHLAAAPRRRRCAARRKRRQGAAALAAPVGTARTALPATRAECRRGWRTLPSEMVASPYTPRRSAGLAAYENALARAGLAPVAGIDEAGRGACAGPLVVAAVVLDKAAIRRIRRPRRLQAADRRPPARPPTSASSARASTGT